MLRWKVDKLEDVEEPLRAQYKLAGDGKFYLQTEEDEEGKRKITEFRDNNVKLMKDKEELEKRLKDIGDPAQIAEMKKKLQAIDDKQLIAAGKLDELVEQKVTRMKADYEAQIAALKKAGDDKQAELDKTVARLSEVLIDSEITKAVTGVGGVRKDAMQDIIARGKRVWRLEDGKPVPKEGEKLLFGKDGKNQMTFEEWATILAQSAPFLFESSGGIGAMGTGGTRPITGKQDLSKIPAGERLRMIHGENATVKP